MFLTLYLLYISDVDDSEKPLRVQASNLKSYLGKKEDYLIYSKILYPELIYEIMAMSRIEEYFSYFNDSLRDMNTNSSTKSSILSLNDLCFKEITKFLDNINLTNERCILKNKVDIMANDFKINFHSETRGTFNEEIFNFYKTFILPFYSLETMFSNTYDNIKEILNAGKAQILDFY